MAWTVASAFAGKQAPKFTDFLPKWGRKRRQTSAEMLAVLRGFAARREARRDNR